MSQTINCPKCESPDSENDSGVWIIGIAAAFLTLIALLDQDWRNKVP